MDNKIRIERVHRGENYYDVLRGKGIKWVAGCYAVYTKTNKFDFHFIPLLEPEDAEFYRIPMSSDDKEKSYLIYNPSSLNIKQVFARIVISMDNGERICLCSHDSKTSFKQMTEQELVDDMLDCGCQIVRQHIS